MSDRNDDCTMEFATRGTDHDGGAGATWCRPTRAATRVFLGVASPALMFGLESLVGDSIDMLIGASAHSLEELLAECRTPFDCVVLADPVLCADGVREFMRLLLVAAPRAHVVFISDSQHPHTVREAFQSGACGFLTKTATTEEIRAALAEAARGQRHVAANVATHLAESLVLQDLTRREMDVLRLLTRGDCNKIIARELTVTVGTVKTHVRAIMGKLGSTSRTDAALKAYRLGLVRMA
jgi:two-component system NarL family response regulator